MRHLLGLVLLSFLVAFNCEGRKTKQVALTEALVEFNKTVTIEIPIYEPEAYAEQTVDTLLQNGYKVHIKAYTDMNHSVLFTKIKDTINYQTHYRNFKFDITVEKESQLIYKASFDKEKANTLLGYNDALSLNSPYYNYHKLGVLKSIEVNQNELANDEVFIDIMFTIPETERYALHRLKINKYGRLNIINLKVED